jgi:ABC-type hemin transport system substrate-binding protein
MRLVLALVALAALVAAHAPTKAPAAHKSTVSGHWKRLGVQPLLQSETTSVCDVIAPEYRCKAVLAGGLCRGL